MPRTLRRIRAIRTILALVIAYVATRRAIVGSRVLGFLATAFATIHPELEEASRILGASRLQSLIRIIAPLLRTSVIATWCFIFIG